MVAEVVAAEGVAALPDIDLVELVVSVALVGRYLDP